MSKNLYTKLSDGKIQTALSKINSFGQPHWSLKTINSSTTPSQNLIVQYKLKNFKRTWNFLNLIAKQADILKHHPTITTTYNKIDIELTTHDVGNKITDKDITLAEAIHKEYYNLISENQPKQSSN
ncbi:uncharacterized protein KGF55_001789 [Candida pseudojiufengensis]|uniref:uncharacterized protein n=1 Tax=Candida pseudojiufengensis TaxID=497109 RepID=UPI00222450D2|nr:uncharacterized protein KGF55_001789 [Candida pseudojiufengensis]KAI5964720.1 hypothetical protein KGF55_001789 [Candida pseudojiufengensis]